VCIPCTHEHVASNIAWGQSSVQTYIHCPHTTRAFSSSPRSCTKPSNVIKQYVLSTMSVRRLFVEVSLLATRMPLSSSVTLDTDTQGHHPSTDCPPLLRCDLACLLVSWLACFIPRRVHLCHSSDQTESKVHMRIITFTFFLSALTLAAATSPSRCCSL
jgi:hypothetical protein